MTETRWLVHTLPGSVVSQELARSGCELTLSVASDSEEVVQAVEDAARRNGMVIERVAADHPPRYPATHE
jgi:hypothetical protein